MFGNLAEVNPSIAELGGFDNEVVVALYLVFTINTVNEIHVSSFDTM